MITFLSRHSLMISCNLQTGLCYGKLEAGILTFVIPTVLLGHLVFISLILLRFASFVRTRVLNFNFKDAHFAS